MTSNCVQIREKSLRDSQTNLQKKGYLEGLAGQFCKSYCTGINLERDRKKTGGRTRSLRRKSEMNFEVNNYRKIILAMIQCDLKAFIGNTFSAPCNTDVNT